MGAVTNAKEPYRGFTLVELLVVAGMLALAAMMLVPALAHTKINSPAIQCLSNGRRLAMAWLMYAEDNGGSLAPNMDGSAGKAASSPCWVAGFLDFSTSPDNTNTAMLVNHRLYPYGAYLGAYVGQNPAVFKCPADRSTAPGMQGLPRVRSVSMNNYVGTGSRTWATPSRFTSCSKTSQIRSPAHLFVTLDEQEDSLNDGCFFSNPDTLYSLIDYPAAYHGKAGSFSFADGHSEIHKWVDRRTMPVLQPGQILNLNVTVPGDKDVLWLARHAAGVTAYP